MKKTVLIVATLFALSPAISFAADSLSCPVGQIEALVQTSSGTPGTDAITHIVHHDAVTHIVHHDAVTHTVTITDVAAWDETVTDVAAYDWYEFDQNHGNSDIDVVTTTNNHDGWYNQQGQHYVYVPARNGNKNITFHSIPNNNGNYDKHHVNAVTHIVHHPAVTHQETVVDVAAYDETVVDVAAYDETVIDTPGTDAIPPTFEEQCVTDTNFVEPKCSDAEHLSNHECVLNSQSDNSVSSDGGNGTQPWCSSPTAPGWNVSLPNGGCHHSPLDVFFKAGESYKGNTCPWWFPMECIVQDLTINV